MTSGSFSLRDGSSLSGKKAPWVPVRLIIALLGIYSSALVYTQRAALSVAIVAMTGGHVSNEDKNDYVCAPSNDSSSLSSYFRAYSGRSVTIEEMRHNETKYYDWNERDQGLILGAHFWMYLISPTLAGRLCDKFGGRWITLAGAFGPMILSAFTPLVTDQFGAYGLIVIRVLVGFFHGCVFPPLFSLYVRWFPPHERASANASMSFGGAIGSTVMSTLAGWLATTSWPLVFYVNSFLFIPFIVLWWYFVTNTPEENKHLGDYEREYLLKHMPPNSLSEQSKRRSAPFSKIITSGPVWVSAITKMCSGYGYFLLLSKVPSYLASVFGISLLNNGGISAAMTLGQGLVSLAAGPLSNWIISTTGTKNIMVRKIFQMFAMMGPAVALAAIPLSGCNSGLVIVCLIASLCLYGLFTGGEWTLVSEYAPNSSGTVFGFANSFAVMAGIVGPYLVGVVLGDDPAHHLDRWNLVFFSTAAIFVFGCIVFLFFGTDKPQSWDSELSEAKQQATLSNGNGHCEHPTVEVTVVGPKEDR